MPKYRVELTGNDTEGHMPIQRRLETGSAEVSIRGDAEDWVKGHLSAEGDDLVLEIPADDGGAAEKLLESEVTIRLEDDREVQGHLRAYSDRALKTGAQPVAWTRG